MSQALTYLLQARPEAVGHYFAFLKDCGKHLDPKTRNLISVITKVDAQTERGFKQYLKRALAEGCSPLEVLDALLMAFPTLGLTKIVWAVDIILLMGLPGFDPADLAPPTNSSSPPADSHLPPENTPAPRELAWHDVMTTRAFKVGGTQRVDCDGRSVLVHRAATQDWRVYDSLCPHQGTHIPHLALQGQQLTCPKHGWTFDIASGACTAVGDRGLTRWPHQIVNGRLLAQW